MHVSIGTVTVPEDSLGHQTTRGLSWQLLASLIRVLSSFGFGVVLARMLPPEDFGIIGLAYIATGFVSVVIDLGLGPAIIQRKIVTERHIRVCFTISAAVAVLMTALLYSGADVIAVVFRDKRVIPVLQALAFGSLFSGFSITAASLLLRRLAFKAIVRVEMFASIVGYGVVAIGMAMAGYGYWSLVGGTLTQSLFSAVLTYSSERHSLRPLVARTELRELVGFSTGMSLTSVANYFSLQGDYFVVGRLMDAASLGYYSRAYTLMEAPLVLFGNALSRVLFPAAARIQDDPDRFRRAYLMAFSISVAASLPISLAVVILAPEIILTLYGSAWVRTIELLQILSLFAMFRMTYKTASSFVRARGHAYRLLLCTVVYGVLVIGGSWWIGSLEGLKGVAWSVGASLTVMWIMTVWFANRAAAVTVGEFGRAFAHAAAPGLAIALGLFVVVEGLRAASLPPFAVLTLAGSAFAVALLRILLQQARRFNHSALNNVIAQTLSRLPMLRRRFGHILLGMES